MPSPHGGGAEAAPHDGGAVAADFLHHADFPEDDPLHLAVSGGADSTALLVLASELDRRLVVHHVHHGLHAAADAHAHAVEALAARFVARFVLHRVAIPDGPNLEARAREARYEVLPEGVLTGHTADDQAETVLMNLLRGAGVRGAAGIGRRASRPLLRLRRRDTEVICASTGIVPLHDPTNADDRFLRNRVRRDLIGELSDLVGRDVVATLARHGDLMAAHADFIDELALEIEPTSVVELRSAPSVVARVAVANWLSGYTSSGHRPDAASIDRVFAVVDGERRATEISGGLRVSRTRGVLRVEQVSRDQPAVGLAST